MWSKLHLIFQADNDIKSFFFCVESTPNKSLCFYACAHTQAHETGVKLGF